MPNDYLVIATTVNNYYLKLGDNLLFSENELSQTPSIDMCSQQSMVDYLTSVPESQKNKQLKAKDLYIENQSDNNEPYRDVFTANKLVYCRKYLGIQNITESLHIDYSMYLCYLFNRFCFYYLSRQSGGHELFICIGNFRSRRRVKAKSIRKF